MQRGWSFPPVNHVKVNVHALSLRERLANGNDSGLGVVIRDHTGAILKMYSGSIQNRTRIGNELWSFVIGLRGAFFEEENLVILETDNADAVKEWEDWRWFLDPNHTGLIQQLEQRRRDPNLRLEVRVVSASENRLARWLAQDGAVNRTKVVLYRRLFGRVRELWMLDMGLGPNFGDFQVMGEDEYEMMEMEADVMQVNGPQVVEISDEESDEENAAMDEDEVRMAMAGVEMQGIGQRG